MNAYTPGIERMMKRLFDSLERMIDGVMPPLKRRSLRWTPETGQLGMLY